MNIWKEREFLTDSGGMLATFLNAFTPGHTWDKQIKGIETEAVHEWLTSPGAAEGLAKALRQVSKARFGRDADLIAARALSAWGPK